MLISIGQVISAVFYDAFARQVRFLAGVRRGCAIAVRSALPGAVDRQRTGFGKSVIPFAFWIFSMGGGLMTLVYGVEVCR